MLASATGISAFRLVPVAILLAGLLATTAFAQSGGAAATSFQAYPLKHIKPRDAEARLAEVLGGSSAEVVADERGGRLLVRGTPQEQAIAQQLLSTLDRAVTEEALLKPYAVERDKLADMAQRLRTQFAENSGVRIATDERTSQLLVLAPPSVHSQLQKLLSAPHAAPQPRQPVRQATAPQAAAPAQTGSGKVLLLQNTDPQVFEASLQQLTGRQPTTTRQGGEQATYSLRSQNNSVVSLTVNRHARSVSIEGPAELAEAWSRVVQAIDRPRSETGDRRMLKLQNSQPTSMRKVLAAFQTPQDDDGTQRRNIATALLQPRRDAQPGEAAQQPENAQPAPDQQPGIGQAQPAPAEEGEDAAGTDGGMIGDVQIEFIEGLDIIVIEGHARDVERVQRIIEDIERLSAETQPTIEIYELKHANNVAVAALVQQIYEATLQPRTGGVSITALGKPNALLLIGREESVKTVVDLVARLDQPVQPSSQFQVFALKHIAATDAQATITQFFADPMGLDTRVLVTADVRSNSLIVQASPRDLVEVAALVNRLDITTSAAVNELRIFPLRNSLASDLATVLADAVSAQGGGAAAARPPQQGPPAPGAQALGITGAQTGGGGGKSAMLKFITIDAQGQRQFTSGILSDVNITADTRANTLVVSAPAESMTLIAALINQLDQVASAETQVKVYTIVNGDASSLAQMLEVLFGLRTSTGGGQGQFGQGQTTLGDQSLVPLRFSVDTRTNSIIVSGTLPELAVVEAILSRLDAGDVRERQTTVYRLQNSPALYVATAINQLLTSQRQVQQLTPGLVSPFEQLEREVVVVPEEITNSLIVSATPRFYEEIRRIIEELDERPPMVTIQVLIAEVVLENTDEFGIELGLQDSILFDRSIMGDILQNADGSTSNVPGALNNPGFNFNNGGPLGNSSSPLALRQSDQVAGQGLTNFAVGRTNPDLGFGGLVLSASSESVSILLRALNQSRRLDVLSRPQITALDNQPAFIQVGQRVARITGVTQNVTGTTNNVQIENVGLILRVRPRISPDGVVVMEIDAERSELGPEAEGVPVFVSTDGGVVRSPNVNTTTAQTTVSAADGQTIVLGGLLTESKNGLHRRVPILSDIPILGNLFRYDLAEKRRTELLIIMTPRVIRNELDANIIKQVESSRMSWCLSDVIKLHGPSGLRSRSDEWTDAELPTIYPDLDPQGLDPFQQQMHGEHIHADGVIIPDGAPYGTPHGTEPTQAPGPEFQSPAETNPYEALPPPQSQQPLSQMQQHGAAAQTLQSGARFVQPTQQPTPKPSIIGGNGGDADTTVRVTYEPPPGFVGSGVPQRAGMPANVQNRLR